MSPHPAPGIRRRQLLQRGLAAAGVAAGAPLVGAQRGIAASAPTAPGDDGLHARNASNRIPPATRPGGAYDGYVAKLAARGKFSGVVLLSHRGRTVLSRSYGMADEERGIRNDQGTAFDLSSAGQPFLAVAVLQLVQRRRLTLSDAVGKHLKGFDKDIAKQVNIHHLLTSTAGLSAPELDVRRIYRSTQEVHRFFRDWTRQAKLTSVPGSADQNHSDAGGAGLAIAAQIVEAVTGTTYWDYVHRNIFRRAGMTGSAYYTTSQWLTDRHIAHPYMSQPDGSRVDAVRNLDKDSLSQQGPYENPARSFIGYAPGGGFATAPDLVRFAHALYDGTLLSRPFTDVLFGAKLPGAEPTAFAAYTMPVAVINGPQWVFGRGGSTGGSGANWNIYPDTGWVSVLLVNNDDVPFPEILYQEAHAIAGEPIPAPGAAGGGG